jgi:hypothetical protein
MAGVLGCYDCYLVARYQERSRPDGAPCEPGGVCSILTSSAVSCHDGGLAPRLPSPLTERRPIRLSRGGEGCYLMGHERWCRF